MKKQMVGTNTAPPFSIGFSFNFIFSIPPHNQRRLPCNKLYGLSHTQNHNNLLKSMRYQIHQYLAPYAIFPYQSIRTLS